MAEVWRGLCSCSIKLPENLGIPFFSERLMGGCSIDKFGVALTDETLADCKTSMRTVGAVGGPKWDDQGQSARAGLAGAAARIGRLRQLRTCARPPGV